MFRVAWFWMEAERPKNALPFPRILAKKETGNRLAVDPAQHLHGPGAHTRGCPGHGLGYRTGRQVRLSVQRRSPLATGGRP